MRLYPDVAFPKRIRIQDSQINADPGAQLSMDDVHDRYAQLAYFICMGSRIESYLCN